MALDGKARIRVTRKVLTQAGINREEIDALHEQAPGVGGSGRPEEPAEQVPIAPQARPRRSACRPASSG